MWIWEGKRGERISGSNHRNLLETVLIYKSALTDERAKNPQSEVAVNEPVSDEEPLSEWSFMANRAVNEIQNFKCKSCALDFPDERALGVHNELDHGRMSFARRYRSS